MPLIIKPKILSLLAQTASDSNSSSSRAQRSDFYASVAAKFGELGDVAFVKGIYAALVELLVAREEWDEAQRLLEQHRDQEKEMLPLILVPYAKWLALHNRFSKASAAFHSAGFPRQALNILRKFGSASSSSCCETATTTLSPSWTWRTRG